MLQRLAHHVLIEGCYHKVHFVGQLGKHLQCMTMMFEPTGTLKASDAGPSSPLAARR